MPILHHKDRLYRFLATLMLVCYGFVGISISFQHTDCERQEQELLLRLPMHSTHRVAMPKNTHLKASTTTHHSAHPCAACEWQANNLSLALPTFSFALVPITATRIITTFPRYLRVRTMESASRAPPLA